MTGDEVAHDSLDAGRLLVEVGAASARACVVRARCTLARGARALADRSVMLSPHAVTPAQRTNLTVRAPVAYAPGGTPAARLVVTVALGAARSALAVFGPRRWVQKAGAMTMTPPEPFVKLPIGWDQAFGGPGFARNPVGKGFGAADSVDPERLLLPSVEDPDHLIHSPHDIPAPAGLSAVDPSWEPRRGMLGSCDSVWLAEHWPALPEDFEPAFWNEAPLPLQMPFPVGDETLLLENLHPDHPQYEASLPGVRMRCFVIVRDESAEQFAEVPMHLHALVVDPMAARLELTFGASLGAAGHATRHAFIVEEACAEPPRPSRHYEEQVRLALLEREPVATVQAGVPEDAVPANDDDPLAALDPDERESIDRAVADCRQQLVRSGAPPGLLALFDVPSGQLPDPDLMLAKLQQHYPFSDRQLSEMQQAQREELKKAVAEQGEDPAAVDAMFGDGPDDEEPRSVSRDDVARRHGQGESFEDEDLSRLDLSRLDLSGGKFHGAILQGANLTATNLRGADLSQANLSEAKLLEARLAQANLRQADLTGSNLEGADLSQSEMSQAAFGRARLQRAMLDEASAPQASFEEADLTRARFDRATLTGAIFDRCRLDDALFSGADLSGASLAGAAGERVDLSQSKLDGVRAPNCTLPGACLDGADARRSQWEGAMLERASLKGGSLHRAYLKGAVLEGAVLDGSDLREADFSEARLRGASVQRSNCMQSVLAKSDLRDAHFGGSNLHEAELIYSQRDGARFEGANRTRTKLADDAPALPPEV